MSVLTKLRGSFVPLRAPTPLPNPAAPAQPLPPDGAQAPPRARPRPRRPRGTRRPLTPLLLTGLGSLLLVLSIGSAQARSRSQRPSARCGSPEKCFQKAQTAVSSAPPQLVVKWLTSACSRHHGEACRALGEGYERGEGVTRDAGRAQALYHQGCLRSSELACTRYQALLHEQCVLPQATACTDLGRLLLDYPSAFPHLYTPDRYMQLGCANGDPRACPRMTPLSRDSSSTAARRQGREAGQTASNL